MLAAVRTWWGDDGGRLVAFLVGFVSQTDPAVGYVHFLGVSPDVRGQGLGRALHDRFAAGVRDLGCTSVRAITSVGNTRSQAFHRSLGFTVSEPVADYHGDGGARVCFARTLDMADRW